MERDFKGIWIPKEVWLCKELKAMEKLFLVEIDSLDNENGCFASNDYFSEFFDLSKNRCSEIIKTLEKKGFLNITYIYKARTKSIDKRIIKVFDLSIGGIRNIDRGIRETDRGYSEKGEDNNTLINNTTNNTFNNKKKKDSEFDIVIKEYTTNEELKTNIYEFIKMRKGIKAAITTTGLKRILSKLDTIATNDIDKNKILDNSIMNSWKGIFELKGGNNGQFSKNTTTSKKYNLKREEFDPSKYDATEGDMPL